MSLVEIVENSSRLDTLKALRLKLAKTIDESVSGRDIAALSLRLMDVMDQIKELEGEDPDELDELISHHRNVR